MKFEDRSSSRGFTRPGRVAPDRAVIVSHPTHPHNCCRPQPLDRGSYITLVWLPSIARSIPPLWVELESIN